MTRRSCRWVYPRWRQNTPLGRGGIYADVYEFVRWHCILCSDALHLFLNWVLLLWHQFRIWYSVPLTLFETNMLSWSWNNIWNVALKIFMWFGILVVVFDFFIIIEVVKCSYAENLSDKTFSWLCMWADEEGQAWYRQWTEERVKVGILGSFWKPRKTNVETLLKRAFFFFKEVL